MAQLPSGNDQLNLLSNYITIENFLQNPLKHSNSLIFVEATHCFKMMIELIDSFSQKEDMKGIIVCFDVTSSYLQRVAIKKNWPQNSLRFVDMVLDQNIHSMFSIEENTIMINPSQPLSITYEQIKEFLASYKGGKLEDFAVIDNILPLLVFHPLEVVENFLSELCLLFDNYNISFTAIQIETPRYEGLMGRLPPYFKYLVYTQSENMMEGC